jgi:hypothetical protein
MAVTFRTTIHQDPGRETTGISVPPDAIEALGAGKRPGVVVTINGYRYQSTVAVMGGDYLLPLSKAHREASGLRGGQEVDVTLELDTAPKTIDLPEDLAAALAASPGATEAFDKLAFSRKKESVRQVLDAKTQETRDRRVAGIVAKLGG